jgi:hypothetical protein
LIPRTKTLLLTVASVCLTLLICEVGLRLWYGISPLDFHAFRQKRIRSFDLFGTGSYDSTLGWSLKDRVDKPNFHTLDHGIRRNDAAQTGLRPGNILAVGSSFTSGVQVGDEQSWPAQLERLIGRPVDNGAVGGHGLDQIVLRAEQLLPAARPLVLLVGLMDTEIEWSGYSLTFNPKPFFTAEHGTLVAHNIPVPSYAEAARFQPVITALSYSYVLDRLMARLDPGGWYWRRVRVDNDPVDVSCRLLQRLKQETDRLNIRTILVSEHWAQEVIAADAPPPRLRMVEACARALGYQIADTFGAFRVDYRADPQRLKEYYASDIKGRPEHFSELGNRRVAEIVSAALAAEPVFAERPAK